MVLLHKKTVDEMALMIERLLSGYRSECIDNGKLSRDDLYWRATRALGTLNIERDKMAAKTRASAISSIIGFTLIGIYLLCSWMGWL